MIEKYIGIFKAALISVSFILITIVISDMYYGYMPRNTHGQNASSGLQPEQDQQNPDLTYKEKDYESMLVNVQNTPHVLEKAKKEVERLMQQPAFSGEAGEIRTFLDRLLEYPWEQSDSVHIDLQKAQDVLDRDHDGLHKIKDHILEYLAVQKRVPHNKAPILCFVGPPGVGKTSIAKAIAEATGRKFARISLGGAHNESKIRGFMRTYVGARPGDIANALTQVGSNNPVILLDEIDKIGQDRYHGDPSAALLEVLDPEQNSTFKDSYFDLNMDLSKVMFIATANSLDIQPALMDRMEIVHLNGYTPSEKFSIAKSKIFPKILEKNGLHNNEVSIDDQALQELISKYTLEAGVRQLHRELDSLCRKVIKQNQEGLTSVKISSTDLYSYLGRSAIPDMRVLAENTVGVAQGLGVSDLGGDVIQIEASITTGKGNLTMTGGLGNFAQESIKAAMTVASTLANEYHFDAKRLQDSDIHIHARGIMAPQIDGTSAGTAITTAIVSKLTNRPVRKEVCMTGEINLRGEIIPVGGVVGKLTAAHAAGLKEALIPVHNMKDLDDLSDDVKNEMKIIPVSTIHEVIAQALA